MSAEQSKYVNPSGNGRGRDAVGSLRPSSPAGSPRPGMTIADLDIETVQWLSDELQEGFALYDPDDRLVAANAEYVRLHSPVKDILKPGMTFEEMIRAMVVRGAVVAPVGGEEEFIAARVRQHRNPSAPVLRHLADGGAYMIKETRLADGSIISRENDISGIVAAKEALHDSEERFKSLAEMASDWFWESDENHRLSSISAPSRGGVAPVEEMIGRARWEIVGADPVNDPHWAQHKADLDVHRPFKDFRYSAVPATGMSTHFRVSGGAVFNKAGLAIGYRSSASDDGGRRHFSVSRVPVFDGAGKFLGYRGTSREITKEIMTERRAAAAHQRLLDAIEALPESFILCDAEDRIVLCNSATYTRLPWCKTLVEPGMKYEDALREMAFAGAAVVVRGREEEWILSNLESHRAAAGQRQYRHVDGQWIQVTERKTADGGTVVIRADITKEKSAEIEREAVLVQAREENRAKSTFMANVVHDLRAPVRQIARLVDRLRTPSGTSALTARQRETAESIGQAAEQTLRLVNDVFEISRLQAGKHTSKPTDIDIAALVSECCAEACRGKCASPGIVKEIPPDVGIVHADEPTLRQLLVSIIGNAWGAESTSTTVRVTTSAMQGNIEIEVHDKSVDINDGDHDILMRPFHEIAEETSSSPAKGFGVRLALAGALAREIGAILSVTAPPEGGIRLVLTMPRQPSGQ